MSNQVIDQVAANDRRRLGPREGDGGLQTFPALRMIRPSTGGQPSNDVIVAHVDWRDIEAAPPYDLRR